jgi:hypothetical protein
MARLAKELADGIAICIGRMNSDQGKTRYDGRLDRWTMSNSKPDVRGEIAMNVIRAFGVLIGAVIVQLLLGAFFPYLGYRPS